MTGHSGSACWNCGSRWSTRPRRLGQARAGCGPDAPQSTDVHPLTQRDFPPRNIVFRVPPADEQAQTFSLRMRGSHAQNFTVMPWEPRRFVAATLTEQLMQDAVLVVPRVLILSNL